MLKFTQIYYSYHTELRQGNSIAFRANHMLKQASFLLSLSLTAAPVPVLSSCAFSPLAQHFIY